MELSEIWLAYVNEHMVADAGKFPPVEITASQTLERLFALVVPTSKWTDSHRVRCDWRIITSISLA